MLYSHPELMVTLMPSRARVFVPLSVAPVLSRRLLSTQAAGATASSHFAAPVLALFFAGGALATLSEEDRLERWKDRWQKGNLVSIGCKMRSWVPFVLVH